LLIPKINQKVVGQHTLFDKNENNNTKKQTPLCQYEYTLQFEQTLIILFFSYAREHLQRASLQM
jgi:hypothetical protein